VVDIDSQSDMSMIKDNDEGINDINDEILKVKELKNKLKN